MIVAALVIGLLTAYYFGVKHGAAAAIAATVGFLASMIIPGTTLYIYAGIALFTSGILFAGPRWGRPSAKTNFLRVGKRGATWLVKRIRKLR
jgi:hypothetical protein